MGKQIGDLTAMTTPVSTDELYINDGGAGKKVTVENLAGGIKTQIDDRAIPYAMDLVSEAEITSDVSSVEFTWATGDYTNYVFLFQNVRFSTSESIFAQTSTDGTTFDSGASDYGFIVHSFGAATSVDYSSDGTTDSMRLYKDTPDSSYSATFTLYGPDETAYSKLLSGLVSSSLNNELITGQINGEDPILGIKFFSNGLFTDGKISMYGVR